MPTVRGQHMVSGQEVAGNPFPVFVSIPLLCGLAVDKDNMYFTDYKVSNIYKSDNNMDNVMILVWT